MSLDDRIDQACAAVMAVCKFRMSTEKCVSRSSRDALWIPLKMAMDLAEIFKRTARRERC
jgi:hypothetical protein